MIASRRHTDELDAIVERVLHATRVSSESMAAAKTACATVGMAVAVVQGSCAIYTKGFGVREFGKAAPIDSNTLFQIGSTTKAFTAAALGILVDEGEIQWDDPIIDHLPGFQLQDSWLTQNMTIRDALAHRSGIPDDSYYPFLAVMDEDEAVRQVRHSVADGAFRSSYRYNNLLYAVAGKVVEAASGTPWNDFIRQRLLRPLRMDRSGTSPYEFWDAHSVATTFLGSAPAGSRDLADSRDTNVAMPHGWTNNGSIAVLPWQSYDNAAAAGALVSSAADMANWLVLNLNQGQFEGQQLLQSRTLEELHAIQNSWIDVSQFPFDGDAETYAMGWRRAEYRGYTHVAHGGGIIGFPAYVALLPGCGIAIVVLSNGPQTPWHRLGLHRLALHKAVAFSMFDHLLGAPSRDWVSEFLSRAQEAQQEARQQEDELRQSRLHHAPSTLPLEQYAGSYEDASKHSGRVSVRIENGDLILSFAGKGAYSARLKHRHHDLFRVHSAAGVSDVLGPQFVEFTIDSVGRVVSMSAFAATFRRLETIK